jgi:uncharacterized membrane protein
MIADKFPGIPSRTDAPPLIFRAISGAVCGYAICGPGRSKTNRYIAAAVGAAAALAAAWAGAEYRKRVKLPSLPAALLEDAVVAGSGFALMRAIGR